MIEVRHPSSWAAERAYVLSVLMALWLGLDVQLIAEDRPNTQLTRSGSANAVTITDGIFGLPEDQRFSPSTLPRGTFLAWRVTDTALAEELTSDVLPLAGPFDREHPVVVSEGGVDIRFDLLGWSFIAITRYEEMTSSDRDRHGRFPLSASTAWREGFHRRPLVDEYVRVLSWALRVAGLVTETGSLSGGYRVRLTHDVDRPVAAFEDGFRGLIRRTAADLTVRRDLRLAGTRLVGYPAVRRGSFARDPNFSFGFLMETAEAAGQTALFTILSRSRDQPGAEPTSPLDAAFTLSDPPIRALLRRVTERGHHVGLHGSYNSHASGKQIASEMMRLRDALDEVGASPEALPARQHYLRWSPETWRHLAAATASFDSTLGFAETAGFRCGTCHPYPVFDVVDRTPIDLWEHPLVAMDVALDGKSLQRGSVDRVLQQVEDVVSACRKVGESSCSCGTTTTRRARTAGTSTGSWSGWPRAPRERPGVLVSTVHDTFDMPIY